MAYAAFAVVSYAVLLVGAGVAKPIYAVLAGGAYVGLAVCAGVKYALLATSLGAGRLAYAACFASSRCMKNGVCCACSR